MHMTSARLVVGACSFFIGVIGITTANVLVTRMIREVNRVRREGDRVSELGFTFPKLMRIFSAYRASYPDGCLGIYALLAGALGMAGWVSVAVCLGIIG